jgi:sugar lactone lactonase YvrE
MGDFGNDGKLRARKSLVALSLFVIAALALVASAGQSSAPDTKKAPAGQLKVSVTSLSFPQINLSKNQSSKVMTFTVSNSGNAAIRVTVDAPTFPQFEIASGGPGTDTLGAGEKMAVKIAFEPIEAGKFSASIAVFSNATRGKASVNIELKGSAKGEPKGPPTEMAVTNFCGDVTMYTLPPGSAPAGSIPAPLSPQTGLANPDGVAVDGEGRIYAANECNSTVTIYSQPTAGEAVVAPIAAIGGSNTGLNGPFGIALDSLGDTLVANKSNNTVTVYSPADVFAQPFGNIQPLGTISGSASGLNSPYGIALDMSDNLYVANYGNSSVTVYSGLSETPSATISGSGTGLIQPFGIAVAQAKNGPVIFVSNSTDDSISEFAGNANGALTPLTTLFATNEAQNLVGPAGLALDSAGNLYVANQVGGDVEVYSPSALAADSGFISPSGTIANSNLFYSPTGITLDQQGDVYFTDNELQEILIYENEGGGTYSFKDLIANDTELMEPVGIAQSPLGGLYVADYGHNQIAVYDEGQYGGVADTVIYGENTQLGRPADIAFDSDGNLYVANNATNSIAILPPAQQNGNGTASVIAGSNTGLNSPYGIAVDSTGKIYVSNLGNGTITIYPPNKTGNQTPMATLGSDIGLASPYGITLDSHDNLYVADASKGILEFGAGDTGDDGPIKVIAGSMTNLKSPVGVTLDTSGNLYVVDESTVSPAIYEFGPDAAGNVAPMFGLLGPKTALSAPQAVVLLQ